MLVGDQVICEMFSSKMTSLVAGSITTVTCHSSPTEPFFSMHFRGTQVARRPAKDRLLLTQGTRNVRNDTLFFSTIAHLVGRTLRKIQCIFFIETLKNTITAMLKILWKITWKRKIMAPPNSISKESHWNSIWFVFLSPYPPNECWPPVFLEASPPGR